MELEDVLNYLETLDSETLVALLEVDPGDLIALRMDFIEENLDFLGHVASR